MAEFIINADDFGASHGVNLAIQKAHQKGIVNSASLMVNMDDVEEAVELAKAMPDLNIGLHLNLTNEMPVSLPKDIPLLVDKTGKFACGFVKLLLLTLFHPKALRRQIRNEAEAQIKKAQSMGVTLTHIDGHRHIQGIPLVFSVVCELQEKYNIKRIRVINENIFTCLKLHAGFSFLTDGGIVKYSVLSFLSLFNKKIPAPEFFSILYTCKITKERLHKILMLKTDKVIEIMVHPGMPDVDEKEEKSVFDKNLLSPYRTIELNAVCDESIRRSIQ